MAPTSSISAAATGMKLVDSGVRLGLANIPPFVEMSATNWVSVLKKSLHRSSPRDSLQRSTLQFLLQHRSFYPSGWRLKSMRKWLKIWTTWSGRVLCQRSKRIFSNATQTELSVLKTWQVLRVWSVVTWSQLMKTCTGTGVISFISWAHHCTRLQPSWLTTCSTVSETSLRTWQSSQKTWFATWTLHLVWSSANVPCWL